MRSSPDTVRDGSSSALELMSDGNNSGLNSGGNAEGKIPQLGSAAITIGASGKVSEYCNSKSVGNYIKRNIGPYGVVFGFAGFFKFVNSIITISQFFYDWKEGEKYNLADLMRNQKLLFSLLIFFAILAAYTVMRVESVYIDKRHKDKKEAASVPASPVQPIHCRVNVSAWCTNIFIVAPYFMQQFITHLTAGIIIQPGLGGFVMGSLIGIVIAFSTYYSSVKVFKNYIGEGGEQRRQVSQRNCGAKFWYELVAYADPLINAFGKTVGAMSGLALLIGAFNSSATFEVNSNVFKTVFLRDWRAGIGLIAFAVICFTTEFKMRYGYDMRRKLRNNLGYEKNHRVGNLTPRIVSVNITNKWYYFRLFWTTVVNNGFTFFALGYKDLPSMGLVSSQSTSEGLGAFTMICGMIAGFLEGRTKLGAMRVEKAQSVDVGAYQALEAQDDSNQMDDVPAVIHEKCRDAIQRRLCSSAAGG